MTATNAHPTDDLEHLAGCPECQARAALDALDVDLARVWGGVAAEVWASPAGRVERLAGRLLRSPGLARALVTTPSLVLSWLVASAIVLALGAVVTRSTGTPWPALLAPALAGIGIAYAYGPGIDPAFELSQTMATSDRLILLVRGLVVFGVNALLGAVASLFAEGLAGLTFGWLAPMTAVAALALAAATLARSANVGVAAGLAGWCMAILGGLADTGNLAAAARGNFAPAYLLLAVVCVGLALYATSGAALRGTTWQH